MLWAPHPPLQAQSSPVRYLPGTPWFRLLGIPGPLGAEVPFPFQDGLHHSHRQWRGGSCHFWKEKAWSHQGMESLRGCLR